MTNHKISVKCEPESIANAIMYAEFTLGDNFLEYRDIFGDSSVLMQYAWLNGHIDNEKYMLWAECFRNMEQGSNETFEILVGEEPYCIVLRDEQIDYPEQYKQALMVYAELIASNFNYYKLFLEELTSDSGWLKYLEVEVLDLKEMSKSLM